MDEVYLGDVRRKPRETVAISLEWDHPTSVVTNKGD